MYIISWRQLLAIVIALAALQSTTLISTVLYLQHLDLPEVKRSQGKCLQVINYRNGEGFVCQDVDVTLRKYRATEVPAPTAPAPKEQPEGLK